MVGCGEGPPRHCGGSRNPGKSGWGQDYTVICNADCDSGEILEAGSDPSWIPAPYRVRGRYDERRCRSNGRESRARRPLRNPRHSGDSRNLGSSSIARQLRHFVSGFRLGGRYDERRCRRNGRDSRASGSLRLPSVPPFDFPQGERKEVPAGRRGMGRANGRGF